MKKILFACCFTTIMILCSLGEATITAHKTNTASELNLTYNSTLGDDSFIKKREIIASIYDNDISCTITCYYEDNLTTDYDGVKIINSDAALGIDSAAYVYNSSGTGSGMTNWVVPGDTSNKKIVKHTGSATKWTLYVRQ
ncbi:MAG: hypothetical protein ACI39R_07685 [Lachnospiraceae bacterium]